MSHETGIAIIGTAGRFPGAPDLERFWANLRQGVESISALSDEELLAAGLRRHELERPTLVKASPVLDGVELFDARFFGITPREAEIMDPQQRLLLECAWETLERGGYDPERFPGSIGVFAGAGINAYQWRNLAPSFSRLRDISYLEALIGNEKDYLTTRISYTLGLTGPSIGVQTACSTGLVAVHLAAQALLDYHCDMALAGGVRVNVPQKGGYHWEDGGIASPDGHCRPYDAGAAGTVFGSGVGLVLLKRLDEAIADGDTIHAVIRGTAVNNDGSRRVGFTAPSVPGQMGVIVEALAAAGVAADTISYVEGHGTATPLGDPIEVEALSRAFSQTTDRKRFCGLGSVKGNVGHLDAAAGVAGLLKTVLALEHGELPPSLHFERPNPQIDLEGSPFYVNDRLRPWTSEAGPRRAGVSSFGIGGTNAHVVVEEAPPVPAPAPPTRPWLLLPLSARTPTALDRAIDGVAGHLEAHPEVVLADAAYTLQVGRRRFEHRAAVLSPVEEGSAGAVRRLRGAEGAPRPLVHHQSATTRPVGFLLPGQGSQHPGMGEELYRTEPVFRREVDRAAEILEPLLEVEGDRDLRRYLYPDASTPPEVAAARLRETVLAQPAIFAVSWAAAKLWQSWGVQPDLLLGHSLGEWVAATLAGVFSLPDALALVAVRARLMQEQPAGAMLAVPLSEEEVAPFLGTGPDGGLELAAVNGSHLTVLTGEEGAVERCRDELAGRGLEVRRLHTSHAFHSRAMEPVVEPLRREVERRRLGEPELPWLSNVTGKAIRPDEATDPGYWAAQLRRPVRFAAGLDAMLADPGRVLVEVGPGRALATLARRHPLFPDGRAVLGSMPAAGAGPESDGAPPVALESLARLWLLGVAVDWETVSGSGRRRVVLPTYPFERRRHWIDPPPREDEEAPAAEREPDRSSDASPSEAREAAGETVSAGGSRPLLSVPYVAPRDETEELVADVWQRALGIAPIGAEDDFFELGGHSLLATRVAAGVREACSVEVAMKELFEVPTVASMARAVETHRQEHGGADAGEPGELPRLVPDPAAAAEPFPLTEVQEAYWLGRGEGFELGRVATHSYFEIEGEGFDLGRLGRALDRLIERHGALRTVFLDDGRQRVLTEVPAYEIATLDLSSAGGEAVEAGLAAVREEMSHQVLPADRWPLFEIRATRLPGERLRLHVSFDFLIGDAWSVTLLRDELARLYLRPETELPALEATFRDYVLAERELRETPRFERALAYWRERLPTLPSAPELPLARDPGTLERARFERLRGGLEPAAWSRLKERAQRHGATPSGLLLTAFSEVLATWAKSPRFLVNLTLFNRLPLHPEVDRVVGDFTSLTLIEVEAGGGRSFAEAALAVQRRLWEDLDHRWVGGVRVLRELARMRREGGRAVAPVVFTSTLTLGGREAPASAEEANGTAEEAASLASVYGISQTPQVWLDHQVSESGGTLRFSWDVVTSLFPEGLVEAMFGAYVELLERLAADGTSWEEAVPVHPPAPDLEIQAAANATEAPLPEGLLHEGFFARAADAPERLAVVSGGRRMSYGELAARSTALGRRLRESGVAPGELVGVVMSKGWEQVVAVLGVLAAGGAYLPVGAELPEERRRYLLEHGRARFALTQPRWAEELAWPDGVEVIALEDEAPAEAYDPAGALEPVQEPDDLAYVIFTSGSTGRPKGVMIEHAAALNTVADVNRRFSIGAEDRVLGLSSLSFDLSVWDVFGTLAAGGTVVLPEPEANRDPVRWLELLETEGVSVWNTVPALLEMLVEYAEGAERRLPESLRLALLSGDWIPLSLPERLRARSEGAVEVVSLGGATEASIWSILFPVERVDPEWRSIPYGRPMANQTFRVLGPDLSPRPLWAVGELWIGGVGLARGYWRDEEKTAASFVEHPETGERLYRTGDLGRYRPDGTIEFLGREDSQVKIRGHRIELGEIEATLARHPAVHEAVADVRKTPGGEPTLVAWAVPSAEARTAPRPTPWIEPDPWNAVIDAGREQGRRLLAARAARARDAEAAGEGDLEPELDALARGYMIETLRRLGAFAEAGERSTPGELVASHGILERYTRLLREWLRSLAEGEYLAADGEGFRAPRPLPEPGLDEIWERLRAAGALTGAVGALVRGSGDRLAEILRGEIEPLEVFFPGGDQSAAEEFYASAHGSHNIAAALVRAAAGGWPEDRVLRVLEIGAGTGGTTTSILPALPREGVEYTFTDVSRFFTRQAEATLGDDPRLRFGVLDIEVSPHRQGYAPHGYDLVVAANVLHNGRDLDRTLDHVASLLAPGGLLVVEEATRWRTIFNVTIGLIEGLTRFEDGWRDGVPFAPAARWGEALAARGFEGFLALPESDEVHGHVLVARTPAALAAPPPPFVDAEALSRHLTEHLPGYMVPAAFVPIAGLPLTANGKVDRRALPEPDGLTDRRGGMVAPRTPTETTLAAIWRDVLGIAEVGVDDNFFDLGGDSILGVQIASKAAAAGLPIGPRDLFEHQTVAALAPVAEEAAASAAGEAGSSDEKAAEEPPDFSLVDGMSTEDLERAFARVEFEE